MAGFEYRGQLNGAENPVTVDVIINDSITVTVGDAMTITAGFAALATAGSKVFGIVQGIIDANGLDLDSTSVDNYDGTFTSSTQTYVATSDNTTDKKISVKLIIDPMALFYNDANGSLVAAGDYLFYDLTSESQIDQSSTGATGSFQVWKRDPDGDGDASKGIFRIAEWLGTPYTGD